MMPSLRSGSFSKQNTSFASISGSMSGSFTGQIFWIIFLVEVERPQRSRTSKVGNKLIQPNLLISDLGLKDGDTVVIVPDPQGG